MTKYKVTGYIKRLGKRDDISKCMNENKAKKNKNNLINDLKTSKTKYRWANKLKLEKC